jgi:hypothetical protein
MPFIPVKEEEGKIVELLTTSATSFTKGNGVKFASGYAVEAASGDNQVDYIALETKTSASGNGNDTIKVLRVDPSVVIQATTSITPVQATHVGNRYDISAAGTIDLAATTDKIFLIDRIIDATNKIVEGRFQNPIA